MNADLVRHATTVLFGRRPHPRLPADVNVGSGAVVDLGSGHFLLSAAHVIQPALARVGEPGFHFLIGQTEVALGQQKIAIDVDLDVATVSLTQRQVKTLVDDGLEVIRPVKWPPTEPREGDGIVLAGFPGPWRQQLSWDEFDFGSITILGLVHQVHEKKFVCHSDPTFRVENKIDLTDEPLPFDAVGLSGGPAFLVRDDGPEALLIPHLCGIVQEGGGAALGSGHYIIYYAKLAALRPDGSIGR